MSIPAFLLRLALLAGWSAVAACAHAEPSDAAAVPPKTQQTVAVAPFERVAAVGLEIPDVAMLLARRLSTKGVERVVGPDQLEAPAQGETGSSAVKAWAAQADVSTLVTGRTTRLGRSFSVDARLHSGASGEPLGPPLVAAAQGVEELPGAVDALAAQIVARLETPPPARAARDGKPRAERTPSFDRNAPISIRADELEATESGGTRHIVFTGRVRAQQQGVELQADRLEAFYPAQGSQPDRLVAVGHVEIRQLARRARCDRATFLRQESRVVCTGNARLAEECDEVNGDEIVFDLERETLQVRGGAGVRIHPRDAACAARAEAAP